LLGRAVKHSVEAKAPSRSRGRRRKRRDFALLLAGGLGAVALAANTALPGTLLRPAHAISSSGRAPARDHAGPAESHPILPARLSYSTRWVAAQPPRDLGAAAEAAIVVDLDRKTVLWRKDATSRRAPASLTKMMTAMVALDNTPLDTPLTVPPEATQMEPNVMGVSAGEVVTVRELLYGVFLDSGNDAAETLARQVMPRDRFLGAMNAKAAAMQLKDTHFSNPTGLDDAGTYSSAYDLAVIAGQLSLNYPQLTEIAGTREQPIPGTAAHKAFDPWNLNKMLWMYQGATGLKTGFTDDAGGCVAVTATRGGRHLLAIVLHSDVFFTDATKLLDYGFSVTPA
jgi:D-alanyl-D-alanine carboxypeptidase